ncbi:MAG: hypothetical protein JHC81_00420 [Brevundimonas sp.]|uniref:hypothetical protein n=1 Tax=Brevundimonas sp. TaxID=1871086 RepID=UPI001A1C7C61|nr:hypothetical protein [Brevundimonas sp.]MBJ7445972.1 hypothetical protein [Brevundimonas sp.]
MIKIEAWLGGVFEKNQDPFWAPLFSLGLLMTAANIIGPLWLAGLVASSTVEDPRFVVWCMVVFAASIASLLVRLAGYQRMSALMISLQFLPVIWLFLTLALAS